MPLYPYRCSCGYAEDLFYQSSAAAQLLHEYPPKCARCDKTMTRIPGIPSIQFRGEGWTKKDGSAK